MKQFTIKNTTFSLSQLNTASKEEREEIKKFIEDVFIYLTDKLGEPPTDYARNFVITILNDRSDSGSAGYRTLISYWDKKVLTHEFIHWWNGVTMGSGINVWNEAGTEYLAFKTLKDMGVWTEKQYIQSMININAVREVYPYAKYYSNVYEGEAFAFMRDLDLLIIEKTNGQFSLEDVIKYYHQLGREIYNYKNLSINETVELIKNVTGVDVTNFINERYAPDTI
ncbi:hypothetical protein [Vulcanibacillus modesticaldus]|nr:hypothetical protein [Vulcanibacillus modesticaldus]